MKSSFNAFGKTKREFDSLSLPIWLGTVEAVPVGGTLDRDFLQPGALFPAGTPINLTGKAIKPFIAFEVVSFTAGETNDTIVILPCTYGKADFLPEKGDFIQVLGDTFAATGKAAAVVSVTALTGDNAGKYSVEVLHSATIDTPSVGDLIMISAADKAGAGKSIAVQPNAYLYNDIAIDTDFDVTDEATSATGAAVMYHKSGILIDRTPAAAVKKQMKDVCPDVYQHNE